MSEPNRQLLSGNEAVALAARHIGVALGAAYPGTPSTEILEHFHALGGRAQWAPNEKVALEAALGAAFAEVPALAAMKHVGLNVAADPLFTAAYTGVPGALVVVSADDPGMASSQNEQDNRRYAVAAGVPMLEPADSQEAYDMTRSAYELSARWRLPVLLRMTTRVCHTKTPVAWRSAELAPIEARYRRDIAGRVMIPPHARAAHRRLRAKLAEIARWNEDCPLNREAEGRSPLGIIASGAAWMHVAEAAPEAATLKLGMTHPLPLERIRRFAECVERCLVIEENDPYLFEQIRAAGIPVEQKPEMYRFGELNVQRVRRILAGDLSPEPAAPPACPPSLCVGCPHRAVFGALKQLDCIVAGDIGCYTLAATPPLEAMDTQLCMGASIGMGLGLRHVLPEAEARRVVSVIGDSTFIHSGIAGLVEMVYNRPTTGHVVLILDNNTTAMTGLQEHPGTGRTLGGQSTGRVVIEEVARALGIAHVLVIDPVAEPDRFGRELREALARDALSVIVARRPCLLAAARRKPEERGERSEERGGRKAECGREKAERGESHSMAVRPLLSPLSSLPSSHNVVIVGRGGQGVLKASDILAHAAWLAGCDVKKSEIHGMSQRGGSVASDVRFGARVLSPMVPAGEADILLALDAGEVEANRPLLRSDGALISLGDLAGIELPSRRSANVALLGALSRRLDIPIDAWRTAIQENIKPSLVESNLQAFELGRNLSESASNTP